MALLLDSLPIELGAFLMLLFLALLAFANHRNSYWDRQGIPQKDPELFFGNTRKLILKQLSFGDTFHEIYQYFKGLGLPFGGFYIALKKELMILDLDMIKQVMIKDFQHFTDRGAYVDEKKDPLTGNLFSLQGTKWKILRGKLTPTFSSGKMKMMFQTLVDTSKNLDRVLDQETQNNEPLDIKEILARFTTDVIGSCAFGIECNCLDNPGTDFRKYGSLPFEPQGFDVIRQILNLIAPWLIAHLRIRVINKKITDFFMNLVRETVNFRETNNIFRKDFMHLLIQLKNQGKLTDDTNLTDVKFDKNKNVKTKNGMSMSNTKNIKNLTIEEIAAQSFVFFLAGFETSSTTMTFCLYELSKNQVLQEKLRAEILEILEKNGGNLTYDGIMEMTYMDKVIYETLRKYPPLPFLVRQCTQDWKVPKTEYIIKKGEFIRISVQGIHHDPEYYPEPDKFDPERFSEEEKAKRPTCAYIPFGEGPRICIGVRFGMMETKVGLAVLLKKYQFTVCDEKTRTPLFMDPKSFIMSAQGGIWLNVKRIDT